jgi:hypothetical protein
VEISTSRRIRVIPVTVFLSDFSILAVDDNFTALVLSDFAGALNRLVLVWVNRCIAAIAFAYHGPTVRPFDHVLIDFHLFFTVFASSNLSPEKALCYRSPGEYDRQ